MTRAEILAKVTAHLLTQGEPARDSVQDRCCYRIGNMSCAVGCLIAPEHYDPRIEGVGVQELDGRFGRSSSAQALVGALTASKIDVEDPATLALLERLQEIHDNVPASRWADELASAVEDLDRWIRRGGFLPDAWEAGTCGRGAEH